jgi:CheY-like chemotaxis protein
MSTFDEFEQCLTEAVANLYDPGYWPPDVLWSVLRCDPRQGIGSVQDALVEAIDAMKPAPHAPSAARSRRVYAVLVDRYLEGLTQEQTADKLGITPRHVRREQAQAIHALAVRLWQQRRIEAGTRNGDSRVPSETSQQGDASQGRSSERRLQIQEELSSLQKSTPGAVANVKETIEGLDSIARTLLSRHDIVLELSQIAPNLMTSVHPSALRQVILEVIGRLAQSMRPGQIILSANSNDQCVEILLVGEPAKNSAAPESDLVEEVLRPQGGQVESRIEGERLYFHVTLPSADQTVLVIDDNADMVHLYRRYLMGTKYHLSHAPEGRNLVQVVQETMPDVVVLDVMLPDTDGWEILSRLRENTSTKLIPIVVCTVVREQELALALGADEYLVKPVQRQQFVQTLDRVLARTSSALLAD